MANNHESYRITKIYTHESHYCVPFVLVRADPLDSMNAPSWYFLKGAYRNVLDYTEEYYFGNKQLISLKLMKLYNPPTLFPEIF